MQRYSLIYDLRLRGNIALLYGGGQIPVANKIQGKILALFLSELIGEKIYGIHRSFMGLVDPFFWEEVDLELAKKIAKMPGTYFEMCRNFDPADDANFGKILANIRKFNIRTLIVTGGDGSARACKDLRDRFEAEGYEIWIYWLPCTIDGMVGTDCIGFESAVKESVRTAGLLAINSWATYDSELPRIAVVQVMGRNRDDILFGCMRQILQGQSIIGNDTQNMNLIGIPSASNWSVEDLAERIKTSSSPYSLVLVSEGAKPNDLWYPAIQAQSIADGLGKLIPLLCGRKANSHVVGYLAQTNDADGDRDIWKWSSALARAVKTTHDTCRAVAIVKREGAFEAVTIDSIVELNPNSSKVIPIPDEVRKDLGKFLI